jgi:hypothetical protein
MKARTALLERSRAAWRAWRHRPLHEWPDELLAAFLLSSGAWRPSVGQKLPTDAELLIIIAAAASEGAAP